MLINIHLIGKYMTSNHHTAMAVSMAALLLLSGLILPQPVQAQDTIFVWGYAYEDLNGNDIKDPGEAVEGVEVYLWDIGMQRIAINAQDSTSSNGYFGLEALPGRFELRTDMVLGSSTVYLPTTSEPILIRDGERSIDITLDSEVRARAVVRLKDPQGQVIPVTGAKVTLYNQEHELFLEGVYDPLGQSYTTELFNGDFDLEVLEVPGYGMNNSIITVDSGSANTAWTSNVNITEVSSMKKSLDDVVTILSEGTDFQVDQNTGQITFSQPLENDAKVTVDYNYTERRLQTSSIGRIQYREGESHGPAPPEGQNNFSLDLSPILPTGIEVYTSVIEKNQTAYSVPADDTHELNLFQSDTRFINATLRVHNATGYHLLLKDVDFVLDYSTGDITMAKALEAGDEVLGHYLHYWSEPLLEQDYKINLTEGNVTLAAALAENRYMKVDYHGYKGLVTGPLNNPIHSYDVLLNNVEWPEGPYDIDANSGIVSVNNENMLSDLLNPGDRINITYVYTAEVEVKGEIVVRNAGEEYIDVHLSQDGIVRIFGEAFDQTTGRGLEEGVNIHCVLYDHSLDRVVSNIVFDGLDNPTFNLDCEKGRKTLVIDPTGYDAQLINIQNLDGDRDLGRLDFQPSTDLNDTIVTSIVFSGGPGQEMDSITVARTYDYRHDSFMDIPGCGDDLNNPLLQIDTMFGNGDLTVTPQEIDAFKQHLVYTGPKHANTNDSYFKVDGIGYFNNGHQYNVQVEVQDLSSGVHVSSKKPLSITTTTTYQAMGDIVENKDSYQIELYITRDKSYGTEDSDWVDQVFKVKLPEGMETTKPGINMPKEGIVHAIIDPGRSTAFKQVLNIVEVGEPVAAIDLSGSYLRELVDNEAGDYIARAGSAVFFDGTVTMPGNDFEAVKYYEWSFGDGTSSELPVGEHVYTSPGTFTMGLEVTNSGAMSDSVNVTVIVDGEAPTAVASSTITQVDQGAQVQFQGSGSSDNLDYLPLEFRWDFGDSTFSQIEDPAHTFTKFGRVQVSLTVFDAVGLNHTDTITITVNDVELPSPAAIFSPSKPYEDSKVILDGTGSYDPNGGTVVHYKWEFHDDGTVIQGPDKAIVNHTFPEPGNYNVTLTVTDTAGNHGEKNFPIPVRPKNRPDIQVERIDVPDIISGRDFQVKVRIANNGSGNLSEPITVRLYDGDKELDSKEIKVLDIGESKELSLKGHVNGEGVHEIRVVVHCPDEYGTQENNEKGQAVEVQASSFGTWIIGMAVLLMVLLLFFKRKLVLKIIKRK